MGAVLREQNALPCGVIVKGCLKAKDDVDNVGAGRAAKGANPSSCLYSLWLKRVSKVLFLLAQEEVLRGV